jgi:hypothetical protein
MKLNTNIDVATQKRLVEEAIAAQETEVFGVLLRYGVDVDTFDEATFSESFAENQTDVQQWKLDVKKKLETIASLKSRLEKLV